MAERFKNEKDVRRIFKCSKQQHTQKHMHNCQKLPELYYPALGLEQKTKGISQMPQIAEIIKYEG